jgi:hypothetical protein
MLHGGGTLRRRVKRRAARSTTTLDGFFMHNCKRVTGGPFIDQMSFIVVNLGTTRRAMHPG